MVRISNKELIKELIKNSRIRNVELARRFNVSETAIRKAIKNLEENGAIQRYTIDFNPKELGYNVHVILGIDTTPETYLDVINDLKSNEKIFKFYTSSGDHMLMLELFLKDSKELDLFIKDLKKIEGIVKICPAIILERIK